MKKTTLGLVEDIVIQGKKMDKRVTARIDTGATKGSIDRRLAKEIGLGPVVRKKVVKSASGISIRPMVKGTITLKGREVTGLFTIANRKNVKYRALIGQDILKQGFLIDPNK